MTRPTVESVGHLGPGARLPPLLISSDEAVAVAVGLRHAAIQPVTGISDAAVRALTKIADILPPAARSEIEAVTASIGLPTGPATDVHLDVITALARACEVEPGATRINMDVDDLSWIVLMLAALNADIRHAEPPELVTLLHTLGSRFTAARSGR